MKTSGSWICIGCWQELHDFHKFYLRVEEAHAELDNIKSVTTVTQTEEDYKPAIENVTFEPEISLKETLQNENFPEEDVVIKEEDNEEPLVEETLPLTRNKKTRQAKIISKIENECIAEDPLSKTKQSRKSSPRKAKTTKVKELTNNNDNNIKNETIPPITQEQTIDNNAIKDDPDVMDTNGDDEVGNNADTDTDSNYDPDEDCTEQTDKKSSGKSTKSGNHENDKFLMDNFKITCSICQIQTSTFHALCKHFKSEHKQNGFVVCCKKKFYRRSLLVDHVHQHVNPNYFKCIICDKVMADRKCLNMHKKTHNDKKEKVHACDICDKKFSMSMSLKLHKMSHLSEEEKHIPCTECGKK